MRLSLLILPIVAALLLGSCQGAGRHPDVRVGAVVPELELPTLAGEIVSLRDFAGRPMVLNFWATWCGPCIQEIPTLKALSRDAAFEVVTVAIDKQGAGVVQPFVERQGIDYPVLIGDEATFARFNGRAIPYTLVLDASLRIVSIRRGYVSLRSLERDLRRAET